MGTIECSQPESKSSWDSQDFGDISMVLKMAHFRKSTGPRWVKIWASVLRDGALPHITLLSDEVKGMSPWLTSHDIEKLPRGCRTRYSVSEPAFDYHFETQSSIPMTSQPSVAEQADSSLAPSQWDIRRYKAPSQWDTSLQK